MNKIDEISYAYNGMDVYFFNPTANTQQALDLNLIVAKNAPKTLGIFDARKKEIFQSQEVEDFYKKVMESSPKLSMWIKGLAKNNESEKDFDKLNENDKWMFIKTVAYFGEYDERERFKETLNKANNFTLNEINKDELKIINARDTNFKNNINNILKVNLNFDNKSKKSIKNR